MIQSDTTGKDTLAIDHKGKKGRRLRRKTLPPHRRSEMKPPNETREKEGGDRHRSDIAKAIMRDRSRET